MWLRIYSPSIGIEHRLTLIGLISLIFICVNLRHHCSVFMCQAKQLPYRAGIFNGRSVASVGA